MTAINVVLDRLHGVRKSGSQWMARCPAHDDKHPSLSIAIGGDGRLLLRCHAGCRFEHILSELGLVSSEMRPCERRQLLPLNAGRRSTGYDRPDVAIAILEEGLSREDGPWREPTVYTYRGLDGAERMRVLRWDNEAHTSKTFRPIHARDGRWFIGDPHGLLPLYRLDQLGDSDPVVVVEGERCADVAAGLGFAATTSAHGARSPSKTDWSPLAGRDVAILPDNDDAGRKYAHEVAGILAALEPPARVKIVELPGLAEGEDIVDFVEARRAQEACRG